MFYARYLMILLLTIPAAKIAPSYKSFLRKIATCAKPITFAENADIKVFFPKQESLITPITSIIDHEQKNLFFATYILNHRDVINAFKKAHARGVGLYGVVDSKTLSLEYQSLKNSKHIIDFISQYNIRIYSKYRGCMHNKILCGQQNADNKPIVCLGSANLTYAGLNGTQQTLASSGCNEEHLIVIQKYAVFEAYKNQILQLMHTADREMKKRNKTKE